MSSISVRVVSQPDELENLRDVWDSILESSVNNKCIYLTYEWVTAWWRHFGDKCRLNIVLLQKGGRTVGIFPLQKRICRLGMLRFTVLETIGAVNCNYLGFYATDSPGADQAVDVFFDYLQKEIIDANIVVRFNLVPDDCVIIKQMYPWLSGLPAKLLCDEKTVTIAPYIPISTDWNSYFASLGPYTRKRLRRLHRMAELNKNIGYGRFHYHDLDRAINCLFDLHIKRWQSVHIRSLFKQQAYRKFYRQIAETFMKRNWLHISYLKVKDTICCIHYSYQYDNKLYAATVARDLSYNKLEIGHLHELQSIRDAFQKGFKEYDFLQGDEAYKFYWTRKYRRYLRFIIIKRTPLSRLRMLFIKMCLFLIQFINNKHSFRELIAIVSLNISNRRQKKQMALNL